MNKLLNLQQQFVDSLFKKEGTATNLQPQYAIEVYRNNYFSNLENALLEAYPLLQKVVGADFFTMMAQDYIKTHPSLKGYIQEYGQDLANFLTTYQPVQSLPYVSELAQFEWACREIFFSKMLQPLTPSSLNQILTAPDFETASFTLAPATKIFNFTYPILKIWSLCVENPNQEINLEEEGGAQVLITRPELEIVFRALNMLEFNFLKTLAAGTPLSLALPQNSEALIPQFIEWLSMGVLILTPPP